MKDLVKNYEGSIKLKPTLRKINNQIRKQSNPYIKYNFQQWARKYRYKIKRTEQSKIFNKKKVINGYLNEGKNIRGEEYIKEKFIEEYIYKNGKVIIVKAKTALEVIKKYDLCNRDNISTKITELNN